MCMNTNIYKYNSQTRNNMLNVVMSGLQNYGWFTFFPMFIKYSLMNMGYFFKSGNRKVMIKKLPTKSSKSCKFRVLLDAKKFN